MSPAGYWPQLLAAIEAGADAVYFGLKQFSARSKVGFDVGELPDVMSTLHERGVKGFVTFNTLVFDDEFDSAVKAITSIAHSGADAIIVQDVGIATLAKQIAPELEVHGSTQMSITSAQGAELAKQQGCDRVVLGRELSIRDIERISQATRVELEVFVHGALCVSYSGQCFSSEAWGGRSANRGKCAQACRLSYELIVDGIYRDLGVDRYLLSPGDLHAISLVPELIRAGIACLKIEGRYKDENYVALTTQAYRRAIDRAMFHQTGKTAHIGSKTDSFDETREHLQLEQIYSRGLGPHFIAGVDHQKVVKARSPRHRGLKIGQVISVGTQSVNLRTDHELRPGDGVVFDAADWRSPDEPEEGGNIYEVRGDSSNTEIRFAAQAIDFNRIREGDWVWRTNEPKLLVQLKPLAKPKKINFTRPIDLTIAGCQGQPLLVKAALDEGIQAELETNVCLAPAKKYGLNREQLETQLGRLGGTPFHLREFDCRIQGLDRLFLPVSQLNELRRRFVNELIAKRRSVNSARVTHAYVGTEWRSSGSASDVSVPTPNRLHFLVRNSDQLDAAIRSRPASITLDYLELYGLRPAVEKVREAGLKPRVASPRILKPAEQRVIRFLLSLDCEILVRSGGLLFELLQQPAERLPNLIGDFSLNVANVVSARHYLDQGLNAITPTYDLNAQQVQGLCGPISPAQIEVIAYSHLPVFHTEHCVFCRFMSDGSDHTNCGHPCEKHRVALRDQAGREHPVMADVGCRNTVFGAESQVSVRALNGWMSAGLADFRLEFVHETPEQVQAIGEAFKDACNGELDSSTFTRILEQVSPAGITEGSLYVPKD